MENKLVYNIEAATPSMIRSLDWHCRYRKPDGTSDIDPDRSHLNRFFVGSPGGVLASLEALYATGVKRPAAQSESPYLRMVVSASAAYFRPDDPKAEGTWDEERLEKWLNATLKHLREVHGDDLVHVELHLDEVTPHLHVVVAPTYTKKPRKPGRRKRNESEDDFEMRKAAAENADGVRTVGRASHPELARFNSFQRLRQQMALAVEHLGIVYGEDRMPDAPDGKTTRQWVKEEAVRLRNEAERSRALIAKLHAEQEKLQKTATQIFADAYLEARQITNDARKDANAILAEAEGRKAAIEQREAAMLRQETSLEAQSVRLKTRESELIEKEQQVRSVWGQVRYILATAMEILGIERFGKVQEDMAALEDAIADMSSPEESPEDPDNFSGPSL